MNSPAIRFAGFTDAWEQRKLGEICTITTGFPFKSEDFEDGGNYLVLTNVNIQDNQDTVDSSVGNRISIKDVRLEDYILSPGDILVTMDGTVGRTAKVVERDQILAQRVGRLVANEDNEFLYQLLNTGIFSAAMAKISHGGTIKHISLQEIGDYFAPIPKLKEQTRVGEFFHNIDRLITLHQREHDKTVNIKKALLEKMFPKAGEDKPEIRFAGFTGAWEQRKLGEVANIVGGGTPNTNNSAYWNGDIDWYAPAEIGEQIFLTGSQKKITTAGLQKSSATLLPIGSVLFTSRAGIGKTAILAKQAATNQGFQSIVPNPKIADSYFIFSRADELKKYAETVGAGSTFTEVSGKQMSRMQLLMPKIEEQIRIGTFFSNIDRLIALHQRELTKFQNIKKALLEKMFV